MTISPVNPTTTSKPSAVNPAPLWDIWNYLINTGIDGLSIRATEAIDISPSTGNALQVKAIIEKQLQTYNWMVTRSTNTYLLIEPRYTMKFGLHPGDTIYHVTKKANRSGIAKTGLEPRIGGGTRMNRSYPPRIFFATGIHAAFQFVDFQSGPHSPNVSFNADGSATTSAGGPTVAPMVQDLYRVTVPDGVTFYQDVLFPGKAVWCESPIAVTHLVRVSGDNLTLGNRRGRGGNGGEWVGNRTPATGRAAP